MKTKTSAIASTRPRFSRLRKFIKISSIAVCFLLSILFLLSSFERWRGRKAWTEAEARLNAAGIRTQWAEVIPSPIPDDQNLAMARILTGCVRANGKWSEIGDWESESIIGDTANTDAQKAQKLYTPNRNAKIGDLFDFPISENESLDELTKLIEPYRAKLQELRDECAKRPNSYLPGDYSRAATSPIPSFQILRSLTRLLTAEAILALDAGNTALALENCLTISRIANLNPQVSFLINTMIETVMVGSHICEILSYGLSQDAFNEAELDAIIKWSAETDLIAKLGEAFEFELMMSTDSIKQFIAEPVETMNIFGADGTPIFLSTDAFHLEDWVTSAVWFFTPAEGWNWQMLTRLVNYMGGFLESYDPENGTLDKAKLQANLEKYQQIEERADFFDGLLLLTMPAFEKVSETTLDAQRKVDLIGITATLALRSKQGKILPESLDSADFEQSLAKDPESDTHYSYRTEEKGFTLSSEGADGLIGTEDDLIIAWQPIHESK